MGTLNPETQLGKASEAPCKQACGAQTPIGVFWYSWSFEDAVIVVIVTTVATVFR